MENPELAQNNLDRKIEIARSMLILEQRMRDLKDAMAMPDAEPAAKIQDAELLSRLEADLASLRAKHDSL